MKRSLLHTLLTALLVAMAVSAFVSCHDDDGGESAGGLCLFRYFRMIEIFIFPALSFISFFLKQCFIYGYLTVCFVTFFCIYLTALGSYPKNLQVAQIYGRSHQ